MILNEYNVRIFNTTVTCVGTTADSVAKFFPDAESIELKGSHYFLGNGTSDAQSLTKSVVTGGYFIASCGEDSVNSGHSFDPEADPTLSVSQGDTVDFGVFIIEPAIDCYAYRWQANDSTDYQYGENISITFDNIGSYVIKCKVVADGGQPLDVDGDFWYFFVTIVVT